MRDNPRDRKGHNEDDPVVGGNEWRGVHPAVATNMYDNQVRTNSCEQGADVGATRQGVAEAIAPCSLNYCSGGCTREGKCGRPRRLLRRSDRACLASSGCSPSTEVGPTEIVGRK